MKSISEPRRAQLRITDVDAQVGGQHVLQGLSLDVQQGEFLSIVGHNGAGKSTLLRTIIGLVKPKDGRVEFEGADITGSPTPHLVNSGIGLVPQQRGYFENLSVEDGQLNIQTVLGRDFFAGDGTLPL